MKCYVCNREMGTKNIPGACKTHREHIIHNAIGGRLVSDKILCEECGKKYSAADAKFVKLFGGFLEMLRYKMTFHHGGTGSPVKAYRYNCNNDKSDAEVVCLKDTKVLPYNKKWCRQVDEESRNVYVYSHRKIFKNLKEMLSKEYPNYKIINYESMGGAIAMFFSEDNPNFYQELLNGIIKIGVEYALSEGFNRDVLNRCIKVNGDGAASIFSYEKAHIFPYYPYDNFDMVYERIRPHILGYPTHSVELLSYNNYLFAFVDLFSTFQFWILLSDIYDGESVNTYFCHSIMKELSAQQFPFWRRNVSPLIANQRYNIDKEIIGDYTNWKFKQLDTFCHELYIQYLKQKE